MRADAVQRFRAWCLLATFVATLGLTGLNADHLGIIDIACGVADLPPAQRPLQIGAATTGEAQHCPVCHFIRVVSGASTTSIASLFVADGVAILVAQTTHFPPVVDRLSASSRGPPTDTPVAIS